ELVARVGTARGAGRDGYSGARGLRGGGRGGSGRRRAGRGGQRVSGARKVGVIAGRAAGVADPHRVAVGAGGRGRVPGEGGAGGVGLRDGPGARAGGLDPELVARVGATRGGGGDGDCGTRRLW